MRFEDLDEFPKAGGDRGSQIWPTGCSTSSATTTYMEHGRIYGARTLIITVLLVPTVFANDLTSAQTAQLPPQQQVLTFIADAIDWYRHLPTAQRIGTEPADLIFLEDNRPIATEVVRLSFEFGKAVAGIYAVQNLPDHAPSSSTGAVISAELEPLRAAKQKLDANTQQAVDELKPLTQARLTARGGDRKKLDSQMAEIQSRIQVLKAMSANYQRLISYAQTTSSGPDGASNLQALVENLEQTVPEVSAAARAPSQTSSIPVDGSRASDGIMDLISQVSALARKGDVVDGVIQRTDTLIKSLQILRALFIEPFRREFSALSLDTKSLDVLEQQQSRLTDLTAKAEMVVPAVTDLTKERILLDLYRTHLDERRSEIQGQYRAALKTLSLRLGALGVAIAVLLGVSFAASRLAYKHVHDLDTRQVFLAGEQVLLWLTVLVLVVFAFAFNLSSFATFLGLLSAGLAVGLHDIFLAIAGYVLLVWKFHVRVGDRVQIAGVSGEVADIGLMQFQLSEIEAATEKRTGRSVLFSNSYVFVSPTTPLFRQRNEATDGRC
jgi:hypothetical protein